MGLYKQQREHYGQNLMKYFPTLDQRINERGDFQAWLLRIKQGE